ncbi:MAG: hypothetical protein J7605_13905 [Variovorax sp.]|nr:hypothetical protein [Variovorax sp.]
MKNLFYKYSILGVPLGASGFLFNSPWISYPLFVAGAFICGFGWMIGMEKAGQEALEKQNKKKKGKREDEKRPLTQGRGQVARTSL